MFIYLNLIYLIGNDSIVTPWNLSKKKKIVTPWKALLTTALGQ